MPAIRQWVSTNHHELQQHANITQCASPTPSRKPGQKVIRCSGHLHGPPEACGRISQPDTCSTPPPHLKMPAILPPIHHIVPHQQEAEGGNQVTQLHRHHKLYISNGHSRGSSSRTMPRHSINPQLRQVSRCKNEHLHPSTP